MDFKAGSSMRSVVAVADESRIGGNYYRVWSSTNQVGKEGSMAEWLRRLPLDQKVQGSIANIQTHKM